MSGSTGRRRLDEQFAGKGKNNRSGPVHVYSAEELEAFQAQQDATTESTETTVASTSELAPKI